MSKLIIRDIDQKDIASIKEIVREVWDWDLAFNCEDVVKAAVDIYFAPVLHDATFARVAVLDGIVVGVIFGAVEGKNPCYKHLLYDVTSSTLAMIKADEANRNGFFDYMTKQKEAYTSLICGIEGEYDAVLDFMVMSKKAQGKGIGKKLWLELKEHFESQNVKKAYVFSDNECNFEFYEKQGFVKRKKTDMLVVFAKSNDATEQYLYEYSIEDGLAL